MRAGLKATVIIVVITLVAATALARPPIRRAFFSVYTGAENSRLDDVPSNAGHCGLCHFDFDGGGARNPYGLAIEIAINSGLFPTTEDAIVSVENDDSDNDGYFNIVEITDILFSTHPHFPV